MDEPQGQIDYVRLLAELKAGDEKALAQAYRDTFGGQLGRFVLIHFLHQCGVGAIRGRDLTGEERAYQDGQQDAALRLMELAGISQQAAAIVVAADELEGPDHEHGDANPGGEYGDEPELDFT